MIASIVIKIAPAATLYPAMTADSTAASQVDNKRFRKAANIQRRKSFNATLFRPRVKDRNKRSAVTRPGRVVRDHWPVFQHVLGAHVCE